MIEIVALDLFYAVAIENKKLQKLKIFLTLIACIFSVLLKVEKSTFIF